MQHLFTPLRAFSQLVFFFVVTQAACAQGNLKFSQVKYVTLSGNGLYSGPTSVQTIASQNLIVAANHVAKIESIFGISLDPTVTTGYGSVLIDDAICARTNTSQVQSFPIWLPAGTYTLKLNYYNQSPCNGCTPSPYPMKVGLSAIDFEIVP